MHGKAQKLSLRERKPHVTYFKPRGIPMTELTETLLTVEGLEALRLPIWKGSPPEKALNGCAFRATPSAAR
ncbi:MAG: hypothetical protein ACLSHC_12605 [Bilophila wadsworthia]